MEDQESSPTAIGRIDPVFSRQRLAYDSSTDTGLDVADLAPDPLGQFRRWYDDALTAHVVEPNAMTLATIDPAGAPSARTVLLKHADRDGFVFFTNLRSRKGTELAAHPVAALVIGWLPIYRQVRVRGTVEQVSEAATTEYFRSRPWGSRIGAWASHQSQPAGSRAELEQRWAQLGERWPDHGRPDDVPVPPHWGGYLVRPVEVEFWQGRPSRMHDRLVFLPLVGPDLTSSGLTDATPPALDDGSGWRVERRQP